MTWHPISKYPLQFRGAGSGAVLKFYSAGTSSNINVAGDVSGTSQVASVLLNDDGYPTISGSITALFAEEDYKIALYPDQTAADLDSGFDWELDNIVVVTPEITVTKLVAAELVQTTTAVTSSGGIATCDLELGTVFTIALTENTEIRFSGQDPTNSVMAWVRVTQHGVSSYSVTWEAAATQAAGGTAPTMSAGVSDVDIFQALSIGGTAYISIVGQDYQQL